MSLAFLTYTPFIMAQFYPKFYTMIPGGLLVGFGGAPLWCAKCTYLTIISETYGKLTGVASDVIVTRFFGVFFMFYQFSQVWGNLISSAVLSFGSDESASSSNLTSSILGFNSPSSIKDSNSTLSSLLENSSFNSTTSTNLSHLSAQTFPTTLSNVSLPLNLTSIFLENSTSKASDVFNMCGADFCPGAASGANPNLEPPPASKIHLIAGIYLACMIAACLIIAIGVDPLTRYQKKKKDKKSPSGCKLLAVTMKQLGNPLQLLILPITMFIGAEQAFIAADFNAVS